MYLVVIFLSGCSSENAILDDNLVSEENSEEFATRSVKIVTVCVDAYVDVGGGGGATYSVYKGTTCRTCMVDGGYEFQDGEYPAGGFPEYGTATNYGSGGNTHRYSVGDDWRFRFNNIESIYGAGSSLNVFQKGKLEGAIQEYLVQPESLKEMYNKLVDKKIYIKFSVNKNQIHPAQYDMGNSSITFISDDAINWFNLSEEVLHAVQHHCYYGDVMNNEDSNYEFEAKVFHDFATLVALNYDRQEVVYREKGSLGQSASFASEYGKWLLEWSQKGYLPASEYTTFKRLGAMWKSGKGTFKSNIEPKMLEYFRKPRPMRPL